MVDRRTRSRLSAPGSVPARGARVRLPGPLLGFLIVGSLVLAAAAVATALRGPERKDPGQEAREGARARAEPPSDASASAGAPDSRENLVLITLDTTRADRLGCYGARQVKTPNIDRLAARGALFENGISTAPLTLPAHVSLMTGLYPARAGVRDNQGAKLSEDKITLAEVLKAHGWRTAAFVSAYVLDSRCGLDQGFDTYVDDFRIPRDHPIAMDQVQRRGDETVRRGLGWLEANAGTPFFIWIHLYDPHLPYDPPEPYATEYRGRPYDGEIAWTDSLVGRVVARIDELGLGGRTIVVVVADHGESLGEHGEKGHGLFLYESTTRIPLIMAGPTGSIPRARIPEVVRIVDVAPTLVDLLGLGGGSRQEMPGTDGKSLRTLLGGGSETTIIGYSESFYGRYHFGWSELRASRTMQYHFIEAPRPELYDLAADPGETKNRAKDLPRIVAGMRATLSAVAGSFAGSSREPGPASSGGGSASSTSSQAPPEANDPEALEKLAALGYAGGIVPTGGASFGSLPDPKDRIDVYNLFLTAQDEVASGAGDRGVATLRKIVAAHPEIVDAQSMLGSALAAAGDFPGAAQCYRAALRTSPDDGLAMVGLAGALGAAGSVNEAVEEARRFLARNQGSAFVHQSLGKLLFKAGRYPEAESEFTAALGLAPDLAEAAFDLGAVRERLADNAGAEKWYARALAIDSQYAEAHAALARRRFAAKDYAGAADEMQKAIAIDPANRIYRDALDDLQRRISR